MIIYFGSLDLSASAILEILRLKIKSLSSVAQCNINQRIREICLKEQKESHLALRRSTGEWNRSVLDDFLRRTASGLSDDEQRGLTHIGAAEQDIIDRVCTNSVHGCCVANGMTKEENTKGSKRHRARKHDTSRNGPGHRQSSKASASPHAHTTGFTPINQYQPQEMTHATDRHSPRRLRHEFGPPRNHHYQTSDTSTATNFQSPYGPSGNNYGRLIDNQPMYKPAIYGGGRPNAGAPSQSLDYPYAAPAPAPHSGYHAGSSDREGERRSTRPTEISGYPSTKPAQKRPLAPGYRDDVY